MHRQVLHFLLVPDESAARRVRRAIAQATGRSGIIVGTWRELVRQAQEAYFRPPITDWDDSDFETALELAGNAFWSESYSVAPEETAAAVKGALASLLSATDPHRAPQLPDADRFPGWPRRIVADLLSLPASLGERLPGDLAMIRDLLSADSDSVSQPIRVSRVEGIPQTTRWQDALIDKLNGEAGRDGVSMDGALERTLEELLQADPQANPESALGVLQARLFESGAGMVLADQSVQWVGVRDYQQEAEIVAGMVQTLFKENPDLEPRQVGLLVPEDFPYCVAVEDAFRQAGLAVSGLPGERWRRDLGPEVVYHFLCCRQKPAPRMALAVCLSSVLMPWSPEEGAVMAQAVMDGEHEPRFPAQASAEANAMLALIRAGDSEPTTLARALREFTALLDGGEAFSAHQGRARDASQRVLDRLEGAGEIDWSDLRRAVKPQLIIGGEAPSYNVEGVTVWRELHEPWRAVRHLFVLGFSQGRYPRRMRSAPVFSETNIRAVREGCGLAIDSPSDAQRRARLLFRRQLRAVSDSATFLIPRRLEDGESQSPSETLVFMQQLVEHPEHGRSLIAEADLSEDLNRIRHLALSTDRSPRPPRNYHCGDLHLERNLLEIGSDEQGTGRPESPTGLELPMVSPLGWLIRRLGAEPLLWSPESADPRVIGNLTHKVFEDLFPRSRELPTLDQVASRARDLLDVAIQQQAPFLRTPQWQFERHYIAEQAVRAAQTWRQVLGQLGAEILGSEQWLQGYWSGIGIHGKADLILGLDGDRLLIVDYKWTRSEGRRNQMELGFDSQASLYREMAETGGPKPPRPGQQRSSEEVQLAKKLAAAKGIGIVYFTMRDRTCLSDATLPESDSIPGWFALDNDIAVNALAIIRARLNELRQGVVRLNFENDRTYMEKKAGITAYAMDLSPLIDLFALPEQDAGVDPWGAIIAQDRLRGLG